MSMKHNLSSYCIRIVDDDESLLKAMSQALRLDGWQVRTYTSAEIFLEKDNPALPGCLVIDEQMPGISGTELQERLQEIGNTLPIIFLTAFANVDLTIHAFRKGACDFFTKPVDPEELEAALIKAVEHDEAVREELQQRMPSARFALLSDREQSIAPLVAHGLTSTVIGQRLGISPRTVERYRASLLRKLEASSPAELRTFLQMLEEESALSSTKSTRS